MPEILITGGSGFVGGHLVESLVRGGRRVRCLVRPTSDVSLLERLGVELVQGDLAISHGPSDIFGSFPNGAVVAFGTGYGRPQAGRLNSVQSDRYPVDVKTYRSGMFGNAD